MNELINEPPLEQIIDEYRDIFQRNIDFEEHLSKCKYVPIKKVNEDDLEFQQKYQEMIASYPPGSPEFEAMYQDCLAFDAITDKILTAYRKYKSEKNKQDSHHPI